MSLPRANPYADFELPTSQGTIDVLQSDNVGLALTRKAIVISAKQSPYEKLDTFIHEMLHITLPAPLDANEKEVNRISRDLSKLLWSAGYRRVKK